MGTKPDTEESVVRRSTREREKKSRKKQRGKKKPSRSSWITMPAPRFDDDGDVEDHD